MLITAGSRMGVRHRLRARRAPVGTACDGGGPAHPLRAGGPPASIDPAGDPARVHIRYSRLVGGSAGNRDLKSKKASHIDARPGGGCGEEDRDPARLDTVVNCL